MKTRYLVFKPTPRLYVGPRPNTTEEVIESPDLSAVAGVPMHLWTVKKGKVVPKLGARHLVFAQRGRAGDIKSFLLGAATALAAVGVYICI